LESLALYNGQRVLAAGRAEEPGREHHRRGRRPQAGDETLRVQLPPGMALEWCATTRARSASRWPTCAQTLIEGALLTVGIVFLFLNSWRSTVITGLTLPISLIGTFLFMYAVRLLDQHDHADGAEPVRGPADRRRHRGAREHRAPCADGQERPDAALDGTQEIGLAVLATTLSIVAVFLPIGFMGGIIGKFFHEFGITIVAAVLISMFVSFTLDPMLSSVWHDPASTARASRSCHGPGTTTRSAASPTGSTAPRIAWATAMWRCWAGRWRTRLADLLAPVASSGGQQLALVPLLGTEFVPKADFSETSVNFYTPVGSSLEVTEARRARSTPSCARCPRCATPSPPSTPARAGAQLRQRLRAPGRPQASARAASTRCRCRCASGCARWPASRSPTSACSMPVGGQEADLVVDPGAGPGRRCSASPALMARLAAMPGLVDLDSSMKPPSPRWRCRSSATPQSDLGLSVGSITARCAPWWPARRWATGAPPTTRPTT
jgi:HAE1 family hydrophobic/amphiphilic exporter-1